MPKSYTGIDLHSTSMRLCVVGEDRETLLEKTLKNDLALVLGTLEPFGPGLDVAVESCFNWYWLGDGLQDAGHRVHLVHTLGLHMITRAKVKTDRRDARTLAVLLAAGILPEGYIYPRETRAPSATSCASAPGSWRPGPAATRPSGPRSTATGTPATAATPRRPWGRRTSGAPSRRAPCG